MWKTIKLDPHCCHSKFDATWEAYLNVKYKIQNYLEETVGNYQFGVDKHP